MSGPTVRIFNVADDTQITTGPAGPVGNAGPTGPSGRNGISSGVILFLDASANGTGTMTLSPSYSGFPSTVSSNVSSANSPHLMSTLTSDIGVLNSNIILQGVWDFNIFCDAQGGNGDVKFYASVYYVKDDGTETLIKAGDAAYATPIYANRALHTYSMFIPETGIPDNTPQIRIRLYAVSSSAENKEVNMIIASSSYIYTTLLATPIEGPPGPQGPQGIQGPQGPQGIQGPQGTSYNTGTAITFSSDGSATAPMMKWSGDVQTGVYHRANTVGISSGGTERAYVDGNGLTVTSTVTLNPTELYVGGNTGTYYPVVFDTALSWTAGEFTLNIERANIHLNGTWTGSLSLVVKGHSGGWGSGADYLKYYFVQNASQGFRRFIGRITMDTQSKYIIVWLRGGLNYHYSGQGINLFTSAAYSYPGVTNSITITREDNSAGFTYSSITSGDSIFDSDYGNYDNNTSNAYNTSSTNYFTGNVSVAGTLTTPSQITANNFVAPTYYWRTGPSYGPTSISMIKMMPLGYMEKGQSVVWPPFMFTGLPAGVTTANISTLNQSSTSTSIQIQNASSTTSSVLMAPYTYLFLKRYGTNSWYMYSNNTSSWTSLTNTASNGYTINGTAFDAYMLDFIYPTV